MDGAGQTVGYFVKRRVPQGPIYLRQFVPQVFATGAEDGGEVIGALKDDFFFVGALGKGHGGVEVDEGGGNDAWDEGGDELAEFLGTGFVHPLGDVMQ